MPKSKAKTESSQKQDIVLRLREWITVPKSGKWPVRSLDDDIEEAADVIETFREMLKSHRTKKIVVLED